MLYWLGNGISVGLFRVRWMGGISRTSCGDVGGMTDGGLIEFGSVWFEGSMFK